MSARSRLSDTSKPEYAQQQSRWPPPRAVTRYPVPERTEWHNILMWRGLAETVEKYVHKGDKLYIEGEIRTRNWTDNKGTVHYITEVWAKEMEMLTPKGARPADNAPQQQESAPGANNAEMTTGATADTSTGLPF